MYVTSGFGLFFSLILLAPAIGTLRGGNDRFLEVRGRVALVECVQADGRQPATSTPAALSGRHAAVLYWPACVAAWAAHVPAPRGWCQQPPCFGVEVSSHLLYPTHPPWCTVALPLALQAIFGSLSLFGAFWWMVLAITITSELLAPEGCIAACPPSSQLPAWPCCPFAEGGQVLQQPQLPRLARWCTTAHRRFPKHPLLPFAVRGGQASDAGYQGESARNGVIGLSWLEAILFFFSFLAVVYDR